MTGKTLLYRGSLKSCNYHCSYCPFSKRPPSGTELAKDKAQWLSFVQDFMEKARSLGIRALLAVPYGEALIYPWYWEGLARISTCLEIDALGAQTNLSFPIADSLGRFLQNGGNLKKLRLWATFHPEMETAKAFARKCSEITEAGASLCAGAVGVPENISLLQALRKTLPRDTYLWINRMDGLKRPYTPEEQAAFLEIDPYFLRELTPIPAVPSKCTGRLFLEGNKSLRACNIGGALPFGWEGLDAGMDFPEPRCRRKLCSCYLAYGGREDPMNQVLFGPYPSFRIPRRPKAAFFDIEGTLLEKQRHPYKAPPQTTGAGPQNQACPNTRLTEGALAGLTALSLEKIPLFFATTLPYPAAWKRCRQIWHFFSGGVFAGGAHLILPEAGKELFYYLDASCLAGLAPLKKQFHFRILTYKNQGGVYKATLLRPPHSPWDQEGINALTAALPPAASGKIRFFTEENCLQLVAAQADKANGVRTLCQWIGISPTEAAAAGDSKEDAKMLGLCGL